MNKDFLQGKKCLIELDDMPDKYYTVIWMMEVSDSGINTECSGIFDTKEAAYDKFNEIKEEILSDVDESKADIDEYDYEDHAGNNIHEFLCCDYSIDRLDNVYVFEREME